jgi:hypothetical protein
MNGLGLAALLIAHAAIHVAFVTPRPPAVAGGPEWPFDLSASWLLRPFGVDAGPTSALGLALVVLTIASLAAAALVVLGWLPGGLWVPAATIGAGGSLALLLLFIHPWLVIGLGIDVLLLWAVLVAQWAPAGMVT